jgi:hypothetical protein
MMKLSTEARSYAHTLFSRQQKEIAVDRDNQLRHIVATTDSSNPRLVEITSLLYEKHKQLLLAKVDSYLRAYRSCGLILDNDDEQEIRNELLEFTNSQFSFVLNFNGVNEHRMPRGGMGIDNVPEHLYNRFHSALDQAQDSLRAGKYEIALDANNPQVNVIRVNNNYGNIQQNGQNNSQTISRNSEDETK